MARGRNPARPTSRNSPVVNGPHGLSGQTITVHTMYGGMLGFIEGGSSASDPIAEISLVILRTCAFFRLQCCS